ncbi:unnamed protein product [Lota lota]
MYPHNHHHVTVDTGYHGNSLQKGGMGHGVQFISKPRAFVWPSHVIWSSEDTDAWRPNRFDSGSKRCWNQNHKVDWVLLSETSLCVMRRFPDTGPSTAPWPAGPVCMSRLCVRGLPEPATPPQQDGGSTSSGGWGLAALGSWIKGCQPGLTLVELMLIPDIHSQRSDGWQVCPWTARYWPLASGPRRGPPRLEGRRQIPQTPVTCRSGVRFKTSAHFSAARGLRRRLHQKHKSGKMRNPEIPVRVATLKPPGQVSVGPTPAHAGPGEPDGRRKQEPTGTAGGVDL